METKKREIEKQYPTMDIEDIKALEVSADEDNVLFYGLQHQNFITF